MKTTMKKIQDYMMAATFAEAGEWETARDMMPTTQLSAELTWFDKIFMAVTFAEAGLYSEARQPEKLVSRRNNNFADSLEELGLGGVHLAFGTVSI